MKAVIDTNRREDRILNLRQDFPAIGCAIVWSPRRSGPRSAMPDTLKGVQPMAYPINVARGEELARFQRGEPFRHRFDPDATNKRAPLA